MELFFGQIIRLLKYFIFWMIFFLLAKAIFLISTYGLSSSLSFGEIFGIFFHGLIMDISTACYLLILPGLTYSFRLVLSAKFVDRFIWIYTLIVLAVSSFLVSVDLGLYPHWGTRVNVTAFNYINDPVAMRASLSVIDVLKGLLLTGILTTGFSVLYRRIFLRKSESEAKLKWYFIPAQLFVVATLIIPIRGGFDTSPLNLSSVAFSPKLYVNQAASNYLWNFAKSVEKRKRLQNPCLYMPADQCSALFNQQMKADSVVSPRLINLEAGKMPNVVLIILESFSNKVIASLGGRQGIAPNLDSLSKSGTVFTNFYSTGNRSDRGISAVLGGYPSLLSTSIMVYPEKSRSLTILAEYFNRKGYYTSFYYGGDINFYNLKSFVLQSNIGEIVAKSDFPAELGRMTKWGVPDGYLFERAMNDLEEAKEPFMQTIYTVSSHPPYDVPFSKIKGTSNEARYLNSIAYTDSCLGVFIDSFRKSRHWKNSLLIVTADHGHMEPGPTDITDPASYRIPLIWTGGVVDSLQRIETVCMQSDFPATLVHQLGWQPDSSVFARDFFRANPFAFYMLDTGWGYVTPTKFYYFDQNTGSFTGNVNNIQPKDTEFAKAYMQMLHDDFIRR